MRQKIPAPVMLVERTNLPRILVRGKGQIRYHAYVNAYVVGSAVRVNGVDKLPLYYLSLLAMRGEGNLLQGVWSALIANTSQDVYLEGVGPVALATPAHMSLGYKLHWNYHQTALPGQDLHAVIESHWLSMWDPMRSVAPIERAGRTRQKKQGRKTRERSGKAELSTFTKKDLEEMEEEESNRQHNPLFLLLVPGNVLPRRLSHELDEEGYRSRSQQAVSDYLVQEHFAFLNMRVPWAMSPEWASYLWERGIERKETRQLRVWSVTVEQGKQEEIDEEEEKDHEVFSLPLFVDAWICQPQVLSLPTDLQEARAQGRIFVPAASSSAELPELVAARL